MADIGRARLLWLLLLQCDGPDVETQENRDHRQTAAGNQPSGQQVH
jgi:hypothetical protein